ncbi:MAG: Lhr family helicase, partial [Acidimicrobiales bacterium]
ELPERRTHAAPIRRGLPVDLNDIGALLPEAIAEVREELTPNPRTPDELHDLLRDVILLKAREEWQPLFDELLARGRANTLVGRRSMGNGSNHGGALPTRDFPEGSAGCVRWFATESADEVGVLVSNAPNGELFPEQVAATVLRGHLELLSPITAAALESETGIASTSFKVGLLALEAEGSAIQGHFTTPEGPIEWCSRRLLARMHGRSRKSRRRSIEPVSPEQFMRFLARWQHVAPGSRLGSPGGLGRVLEQLQGWGAAVASWESDLLSSRIDEYEPQWMDRLGHNGEIQWLRLHPRSMDDPDRRAAGPSKATPISIVYRQDLPWLLPAIRGDAVAPAPSCGAVAEITDALTRLGPRFASDLATDTGRLQTDVESALWDGVARGLFTADGFEAIRSLTAPGRAPRSRQRSLSRLRRSGAGSTQAAGRWSLVPSLNPDADTGPGRDAAVDRSAHTDRDDLVEALADQLLQRWGVLFYDLVAVENLAIPWRDLQWALRRLEDRGLISGGRFVKGFSGEQFALPEAVEGLKAIRRTPATGRTVVVCGTDPLNLTGVIVPGDRTPARRTEVVSIPI